MNFIFISPQFPHTYWNFCDRLRQNGANVLGIGDAPYNELDWRLKNALTEYYRVDTPVDHDKLYRAVAYFAFKYGKPDWIESNNEYWLSEDARLREEFNVTTGVHPAELEEWQSKSAMKKYYKAAGVPTARLHHVTDREDLLQFIRTVGFPVIVKPDTGVGAAATWKLENEADVNRFFAEKPDVHYVSEEFITGNIFSYDVIAGPEGEILFESSAIFQPSVADIVNQGLDMDYWVLKEVPKQLQERGRATVRAFGVRSRFCHLEFFQLDRNRPGLGEKGDFIGLEANMRPAGGYTPDMMDYAHSTDVYRIWADMVCFGCRRLPENDDQYFCAYAGRRDFHEYVHSHEEILARYGNALCMCERMPDVLSGAMGQQMYMARLKTEEEVHEMIRFCLLKTDGTVSTLE